MSINSALIDLHIPAHPASTDRQSELIAAIRRLAGRPARWRERPHLRIGYSYRIPDGRPGHGGGSNWVHTHH